MENMEQLMKVCLETVDFIEELTKVENDKFQAALKNNVAGINDCMKQEQALLLKLKGIDKRREAVQKELGYENLSFRQIIEKAPLDEKDKFKEVFDLLENKLQIYKQIFSSAQNALEVNLHNINKKLESLDASNKYNKTYKEDGEIVTIKESFTSRRV